MTDATETAKEEAIKIPDVLPVLPLKDLVIFPFIIVPLSVSREKSINAVDQALAENRVIMLTAQKDFQNEDPAEDDLYRVGTVAIIMRMLKLPDGRIRILVQGLSRARIDYFIQTRRSSRQRSPASRRPPPRIGDSRRKPSFAR